MHAYDAYIYLSSPSRTWKLSVPKCIMQSNPPSSGAPGLPMGSGDAFPPRTVHDFSSYVPSERDFYQLGGFTPVVNLPQILVLLHTNASVLWCQRCAAASAGQSSCAQPRVDSDGEALRLREDYPPLALHLRQNCHQATCAAQHAQVSNASAHTAPLRKKRGCYSEKTPCTLPTRLTLDRHDLPLAEEQRCRALGSELSPMAMVTSIQSPQKPHGEQHGASTRLCLSSTGVVAGQSITLLQPRAASTAGSSGAFLHVPVPHSAHDHSSQTEHSMGHITCLLVSPLMNAAVLALLCFPLAKEPRDGETINPPSAQTCRFAFLVQAFLFYFEFYSKIHKLGPKDLEVNLLTLSWIWSWEMITETPPASYV